MCNDCGCPSHNGATYTLIKPQDGHSHTHDHDHDHAHAHDRPHSHDPETGEIVYHDHAHEGHTHS